MWVLIVGIVLFLIATWSILLSFEEPGLIRDLWKIIKEFFTEDAK